MMTVLRNRYVRGFPRHADGERSHALPAGIALTRAYRTDAHLVQYTTPIERRLTSEALDGCTPIEINWIAYDLDGPDHTATPAWCAETAEKIGSLFTEHPGGFGYRSRGGYRVLYRLPEPKHIQSHEDALQWRQFYNVQLSYLERRFEIVGDGACDDWQRLHRLPHATRERGGKPEDLPTIGDPHAIGAWFAETNEADVERVRRSTTAFRDRSKDLDLSVPGRVDDGLLYWLLRLRGDVGCAARGGWIVRCPNRGQHTLKTDGTNSTMLFPPKDGKEIGVLVCKHLHCKNNRFRDWLRFFSEPELEAARERAGIAPLKKRAA